MSYVREIIKRWLLKRGAVLSRPPGQFDVTAYKLAAARTRGLVVRRAIDGGAYDGSWTRMFKTVFPEAAVIMVEPRDDAQPSLTAVARELPGVSVRQTLLGESRKSVTFNVSDAQSSILPDHHGMTFGKTETMELTPLDDLIRQAGWDSVDLIKLDLQGYELQALAGAADSLPRAFAVILEVSFVRFQRGMPLALEVFDFMRDRGYEIYDIVALSHRPLDGRMAQADVLFLRAGHPLLDDPRWTSAGSGFWTAS
jgi:FkbM family methyltransferase